MAFIAFRVLLLPVHLPPLQATTPRSPRPEATGIRGVREGKGGGEEDAEGKNQKEERMEEGMEEVMEEDPLDNVDWEGGGVEVGGGGHWGAGQTGEGGGGGAAMMPRGKRYEEVFDELRKLGQGTFGTVRAARHRNLGVEVLTNISKRTLQIGFA